ncbi:MAG: hypothetical protein HYY06_19870 [Deltaproteobacteria bacterium]|nr:hypothetical protein [Deltaproteobacteria bacterium]
MSFDPHGYVSFDTALSARGVLDDLVHAVRIATAGDDREAVVPGVGLVEWVHLPDDLLFGDEPGTELDFPGLRVAQPEKALCDLLWLCESRFFAVPIWSLRLEDLDRDLLEEYARRMDVDLERVCGQATLGT